MNVDCEKENTGLFFFLLQFYKKSVGEYMWYIFIRAAAATATEAEAEAEAEDAA